MMTLIPALLLFALSPPVTDISLLPTLRDGIQPEVDRHLAAAQKETLQELAIADTIVAHFKTPLWQRAVRDQWGALAELEQRGLLLANASRGGLGSLEIVVARMGPFLNKTSLQDDVVAKPPVTLDDHLAYIETVLNAAAAMREAALAKVPETQRAFLFNRSAKLIHEFRPQAAFSDRNKPILRDDLAFCNTWERTIDGAKFAASVSMLLQLTKPNYLDALRKALEDSPRRNVSLQGSIGDVLAVRETRRGLIVLGGKGKNTYEFKQPIAFLADLGGDDNYKGVIASSNDANHPFGILCDFSGNDSYEPSEMGLATGRLGVGILIDRDGNDAYKLTPGCGGCGFAGVGILVDESGRDTYAGSRFTQGAAVAGLGLLLDLGGDDEYSAHGYALGIGGPLGVGAVVDVAGDDHFRCGFHYGSGYNQSDAPTAKPGDANYQYDTFGLGIGIGRRTYPPTAESSEYHLAGGVGIWLDLAGNDRSESSNFSQACAYFFGAGLKLDLSGDDRHAAARYGFAAGAHYGLGLFLDYAGNDHYDCVGPTYNAGCAWDRSVFLLADGRGEDSYDWTRSIGGGRSDRGGWAVFADLAGKDKYRTGGTLGTGSTKGIATFFDGGDLDEYPKPGSSGAPANKVVRSDGGGLFIDR